MKKFIKYCIYFVSIIICIDIGFGLFMDYLNANAKGGGVAKRYYIAKKSNEDILLFGSSRMSHHYVPKIIEDSLGMTCYNCGEDGNGIILSYGFLEMILKRYRPKIIIYDVYRFDIFKDDNMKYISYLKPYCSDKQVMDVIVSVDPNEKIKLISNLYRYNSLCIRCIGANLKPSVNDKGYIPFKGSMKTVPEIEENEFFEVDSLKYTYFTKLIEACKANDIKLICVLSPRYRGDLFSEQYKVIEDLCKIHDVPFWNFYGDEEFCNNLELFKDRTHLNNNGAELFTYKIVSEIKLFNR